LEAIQANRSHDPRSWPPTPQANKTIDDLGVATNSYMMPSGDQEAMKMATMWTMLHRTAGKPPSFL
jgi:hypothetical protein